MADNENTTTWSTQLAVVPPQRGPRLPGDKITLLQSALDQLLAAAPLQAVPNSSHTRAQHTNTFDPFNPHTFAAKSQARQQIEQRQQQLPHPLTFHIVNPQNGRFVYAGFREFSAPENEVALSNLLRESLEISDDEFPTPETQASQDSSGIEVGRPEGGGDHTPTIPTTPPLIGPRVTVHAKQLPKGTYVRLRPLKAGYDPEDWKALLGGYEKYSTRQRVRVAKSALLVHASKRGRVRK